MKYYNGYGYNFYYGGYGYYEYSVNPPRRNGLALYVIIPVGICITCIFLYIWLPPLLYFTLLDSTTVSKARKEELKVAQKILATSKYTQEHKTKDAIKFIKKVNRKEWFMIIAINTWWVNR